MAKIKKQKNPSVSHRKPLGADSAQPLLSSSPFFIKPINFGLICLLLFGLCVWVFWPSVHGEFQFFDEFGPLQVNKNVNAGVTWHGIVWAIFALDYDMWIPLTWISHMLDYQLFGSGPWGHHLTNILLHAANAVLLFLFLRRATGTFWRSLIVAVLFALHPLRVESVAWITERKDVLFMFFGLLALLAYAEYSIRCKLNGSKRGLFYGLTYLFFSLSLLSKQTLIVFPCLLLLLDYWPLGRWQPGNIRRLILEKIPFFVVLPLVSRLSYLANQRGGALTEMANLHWDGRLQNVFVSYARYLGEFFYPCGLSIYYPYPLTRYWPEKYVVLAMLVVVVLSTIAWLLRQRAPFLFVGWFWFVGTLVPVIGFVPLYSQTICNRFTYLPCIGLGIFLVWGIHAFTKQWHNQAKIFAPVVAVVMVILVALTRHEIGFFKNGDTLWKRAIDVTQDDFVAYCNHGVIVGATRPEQALADFQESVKINPDFCQSQRELANLLLLRSRFDDAILHFRAALKIDPNDSRIYHGLGVAYYRKGDIDNALSHLQKAHSINPKDVVYMEALVAILAQNHRYADAVPLLQSICTNQTNNPGAFSNLGVALLNSEKFEEAIQAFQKATNLSPATAAFKENLAVAINAKQLQDAQLISSNSTSTNQPAK